jgi:hypothetical protein
MHLTNNEPINIEYHTKPQLISHYVMAGWMGGWMGGWMDGWMDGGLGISDIISVPYQGRLVFPLDKRSSYNERKVDS